MHVRFWAFAVLCGWCGGHLYYTTCEHSTGICGACVALHYPEEEAA